MQKMASDHLRKALAGDPSLIRAYYYLGWGEEKLGNYEAALKYLNKAVELHPSDYLVERAYYQLSIVYRALNRPAESRAALAQYTAFETEIRAKQERSATGTQEGRRRELPADDLSRLQFRILTHDSNPP